MSRRIQKHECYHCDADFKCKKRNGSCICFSEEIIDDEEEEILYFCCEDCLAEFHYINREISSDSDEATTEDESEYEDSDQYESDFIQDSEDESD